MFHPYMQGQGMQLELAIRLTEIVLAFAFLQQSMEHVCNVTEQRLFLPRAVLSIMLLMGFATQVACLALVVNALFILKRFQGPYNGGSDRMGLLILCCLCVAEFSPVQWGQEVALGYLAVQLLLSYFIAGWVKIVNPDWRTGRALQDVFLFSAYPASERLRQLANWPKLLCAASWAVMLLELLFPFALLTHATLIAALVLAAIFHFANACLFGLNRFFWVWLAAYPSILWLQARVFG